MERPGGAIEGRPWRHALDAYAQLRVTKWLELAAEVNGGWEDGRFGFHWFAGTAGYARFKALEWLYVALRGDGLWEDPAANARGAASPVLIAAKTVASTIATVDIRPIKGLSLRLEGRRDMASTDLYFKGQVTGDGSADNPYVPNARTQTTALAGVVAWF